MRLRILGSRGDAMGIRDPEAIEAYKGGLITETSKDEIRSMRRMFTFMPTLMGGFLLGSSVLILYLFWEEVTFGLILCVPAMFITVAIIIFVIFGPLLLATGEYGIYENGIIHDGMVSRRTFYPWMSFEGYRLTEWIPDRPKKIEMSLKDGREFFINPTMDHYDEALAVIEDRLEDLGPLEDQG